VLKGGDLVTVTQGVIQNGVLIIRNEKIEAVGKNIALPENAVIIDVSNSTVTPGFIDAFSHIGTVEWEAEDQDYDEAVSPLTPHMRIIDALNPENKWIEQARESGITAALSAPGEGNLLSGQSALIHLAGSSLEEMVIKFPAGMHASLGELPKMRYGQKNRYPMTRMGEMALLRQTFIEAREYAGKLENGASPPPVNFKLQSLLPVLEKKIPLIVRANRMDDILSALRLADEFQIKLILNHGSEAFKVANRLASFRIPVLISPFMKKQTLLETENARYTNASLLREAGISIAFQTGASLHFSDLLLQVRLAVSCGLSAGEGLKALTIYPAQIFGVDDQVGSLEEGKLADIAVFNKHPLESPALPKLVLIKGQIIESSLDKNLSENLR
jgi:imidazolonepropionase-like amidohydrolase